LKSLLALCLVFQLSIGFSYADVRQPRSQQAKSDVFLKAIQKPEVAAAIRAEVIRQIGRKRPVALTSGLLVYLVDLRPAFSNPSIRGALIGGGLTPDDLINPNLTSGLAYLPAELAGRINVNLGSLMHMIGVDALKNKMTGMGLVMEMVVVVGVTIVGGFLLYQGAMWGFDKTAEYTVNQTMNQDTDGDGIHDPDDPDDDGDGAPDGEDHYPKDPSKKIVGAGCEGCDINGFVFTATQSDKAFTMVARGLRTVRLQGQGVPLGSGMRLVVAN
jgi:hypothetical protein